MAAWGKSSLPGDPTLEARMLDVNGDLLSTYATTLSALSVP